MTDSSKKKGTVLVGEGMSSGGLSRLKLEAKPPRNGEEEEREDSAQSAIELNLK